MKCRRSRCRPGSRRLPHVSHGEDMAIRQSLGHTGLPEFVGDIDGEAPYRPE